MMVLPAHMTWMCWTRSVHCIGSSCASASAFSRARLPSVPVERAASQPCMRVKKSSPGRMKADLLSGSLSSRRKRPVSRISRDYSGGRDRQVTHAPSDDADRGQRDGDVHRGDANKSN